MLFQMSRAFALIHAAAVWWNLKQNEEVFVMKDLYNCCNQCISFLSRNNIKNLIQYSAYLGFVAQTV